MTLSGPLKVGRGEIVPAAGTRVRALLAGGVPCGLVFEGPAQLRYRVEDRFSAPVAERNVRRFSTLKTARQGETLEISQEISGAVVWGWGLAEAGQGSGPGLPDWAGKILAARHFPPPSHDLLASEANGAGGARYALMHGEVDLLLEVDPRAGEESLHRIAKGVDRGTSFREGLWRTDLAAQPIGRAWWDRPQPELMAEHERIAIENPRGEQLRIVSRSRLRARRAGASLWRADLIDKVQHSGGERPVTVRSVRVDGKAADFLHGDDDLLVALGRELADRETVEVEVSYDGDLAVRPAGHSYWVLGTGPWYPRQGLEGELATLEITVDVPEPWTPFASGEEVSRTEEGGRRKLSVRLEQPMQFAVVTAGKYKVVEETQDGVTCRAATYAMLKEDAARKVIQKFFSARRFFEQLFGEAYPFRDVAIVEINDWGFGQAPPGVIFLTKEFYTAPTERRIRRFFQDRNSRYLHEVAHGWWGNFVKMDAIEEIWLSEAFADYTAALAVWQLRGSEGAGQYDFNEIVKDWVESASELRPGASLYLTHRMAWNDERDAEDSWRLRYGKGPLVIHALRLELQRQKGSAAEGDRYFIALLRSYLKNNRYGWGTTPGLVAELDKLTGGSWQPWFEKYVYGTEIPPVK